MSKNIFEPMKAHSTIPTESYLRMCFDSGIYFLVTDKYDGIRALVFDHGLMSRTLKPIPNKYIQDICFKHFPIGFDGELICPGQDFSDCQSAIMTEAGTPRFTYHVFDMFNTTGTYEERVERLKALQFTHADIDIELPRKVSDFATLQKEEKASLDRGNEGLILRVPWGPYKWGRSTLNEAYMLKLKTWEDDEATIIERIPLQRNLNPQIINEFGRVERSHHLANKSPDNLLGAFRVHHPKFGSFNIGGPFTLEQRNLWWTADWVMGSTVTFKYLKHGTKKDGKPRSPQFKSFRLD